MHVVVQTEEGIKPWFGAKVSVSPTSWKDLFFLSVLHVSVSDQFLRCSCVVVLL